MDIGKLVDSKFELFYNRHKRYIDVTADINWPVSTNMIQNFLKENDRVYYKITNNRFVKTAWIINKMIEYIKRGGSDIDESRAAKIIKSVTKVNSINRSTMYRLFFKGRSIISQKQLTGIKEKLVYSSSINKLKPHPNLDTVVSTKFEEFYKQHKRYIDITTDIKWSVCNTEILWHLLKNDMIYYKITNKRFVKTEWIVRRMKEYLETEDSFIDEKIATAIIKSITKVDAINRGTMRRIFFNAYSSEILTMGHIDKIIKEYLTSFKKLQLEFKEEFTSELDKDIFISYLGIRYVNKCDRLEALTRIGEGFKGNDIRDLCNYMQIFNLKITIDEVLKAMNYRRVGIYKIELANKKNSKIHFDFGIAMDELIKNIGSLKNWNIFCKYNMEDGYTLEKIGLEVGVTRERIRQILKKIENKIRSNRYIFKVFQEFFDYIFRIKPSISLVEIQEYRFIKIARNNTELSFAIRFLNYLFKTQYYCNKGTVIKYNPQEIMDLILNRILGDEQSTLILPIETLEENISQVAFGITDEILLSLKETGKLLISEEYNYILIKNRKITNIDICKWILYNLNEPAHYSIVHEKYCQYIGDWQANQRTTLATLDRAENEGIVRTFTGTYGLKQLGAKKHVYAEDLAKKVLTTVGRPMHYTEIIQEVSKLSEVKDNSIYAYLNNSEDIITNNNGVYALQDWTGSLDEEFFIKADKSRKILHYDYNRYSNYAIKYVIKETTFKNYTLNMPSKMPFELETSVKIVDINNSEYFIRFYNKYGYLYRIDKVLNFLGIGAGEVIYLELLSPGSIRIFKEREYHAYINEELTLEEENKSASVDDNDIDEVLNIFFKDV